MNKNKSVPFKKYVLLALGAMALLICIYFIASSKDDLEDNKKVEESKKLPVKPAIIEKDATIATPDTTLVADTLLVKDTAVTPTKKELTKPISKTTIEPTYPIKVPKPAEVTTPKKQTAKDSVVKKVESAPIIAPIKEPTIEVPLSETPQTIEEAPAVEPIDDSKKRDGLLKRLIHKDEE